MSKKYKIELAPAAERQLKKLVPHVRNSILTQIEMLQNHPRPHGVKNYQEWTIFIV